MVDLVKHLEPYPGETGNCLCSSVIDLPRICVRSWE